MPSVYSKEALTYEAQLSQLESRGLVVPDRAAALGVLSSVSYYRLSGYWYPFRSRDEHGHVTSQFISNTSLDQVLGLYEFDRELRSLVLDAIERIEVAIRTQITYQMGHAYGAFAHCDPKHFHNKFDHATWLSKIEEETSRSSDEFIKHYSAKYDGFPRVPIWMVTEVMSFGGLSFFYKGLNHSDKKAISAYFSIHHKRLGDWLHKLTYIRNVCAHHSRLWNRELAIRPESSKDKNWLPPVTPRNDRIFYILLMLMHLLKQTGNNTDWQERVVKLIDPITENGANREAMGMPENWTEHPLWK